MNTQIDMYAKFQGIYKAHKLFGKMYHQNEAKRRNINYFLGWMMQNQSWRLRWMEDILFTATTKTPQKKYKL